MLITSYEKKAQTTMELKMELGYKKRQGICMKVAEYMKMDWRKITLMLLFRHSKGNHKASPLT